MTLDDVEWELGTFSGGPRESHGVFEAVYDRDLKRLRFERRGEFWEAVAVAHDLQQFGQGRCIAILDSGFDSSLLPAERLASRSRMKSSIAERRDFHGTLVALLAHEIAPEAELLLLEVAPTVARPSRESVAEAIRAAGSAGADVINLSLEFETDCVPRDRSMLDFDVLATPDPPRETFLAQVDAWLEATEPYEPGGCRRPCAVCAELRRLRPETLVVVASGNVDRAACPACLDRCLGLGFTTSTVVRRDGGDIEVYDLPQNFVQNLNTEVVIPHPKELRGTSFAAPLTAGFAALLDDPCDFADMARFKAATVPLAWLLSTLCGAADTASGWATLWAGFEAFAGALPERHQHWRAAPIAPCPTCALMLEDWYKNYASLLLVVGRADKAIEATEVAAAVMPHSPAMFGLLGEAERRVAAAEPPGSVEARRLRGDAARHFSRALELRPDHPYWGQRVAELSDD